MGIGRFAFTPLFPLMQQQDGLSLAQGAWLATANYLGYLVGALGTYVLMPSERLALRWGLLTVAATTMAMAWGRCWAAAGDRLAGVGSAGICHHRRRLARTNYQCTAGQCTAGQCASGQSRLDGR